MGLLIVCRSRKYGTSAFGQEHLSSYLRDGLPLIAYDLTQITPDQIFRYRRFECIVILKRRRPSKLGE